MATRRTRPNAPLTSRLAEIIGRGRSRNIHGAASTITDRATSGGVVTIQDGYDPLSEVLRRAAYKADPPRKGKHLHVSDLLGKCLRQIALVDRFNIHLPPRSLSLTDLVTFRQGDAIHDVIKERATVAAPEMVWGNWSCRCGRHKTKNPCLFTDVDPDHKCDACGTSMSQYHEVSLIDNDYMIVGHPDLLLYASNLEAFIVTELKSISHDQWKELIRPKPDHVLQITFYWHLMKRKGYRLTNKGSILYVTKGWQFSGEPYKEFKVDFVREERRLQDFTDDATTLKAYREGGDVLPTRTCASPDAPTARSCPACSICFGDTKNGPKKISLHGAIGAKPLSPPRPAVAKRSRH